jgi:hypothetical protein
MLRTTVTVLSLTIALTAQAPQANPPAAPGGAAVARTAQQEVATLIAALHEGDAVALWDWLPSTYQHDVETLAHELADRIDAKTYDRACRMVQKLAAIALDKQELVFGNAHITGLLARNPDQATAARTAYGAVFTLLREVGNSDLGSIEGLRAFDGRTFLAGSGKPMLAALFALAKTKGADPQRELAQATVHTLQQDDDSARIEVRLPGKAPEVTTYVHTDGRWLPEPMVQDWTRDVARLRGKIAAMPKADARFTAQANLALGMLEGYVKRLEDIETQAEFDTLCAEVMALAGRGAAKVR